MSHLTSHHSWFLRFFFFKSVLSEFIFLQTVNGERRKVEHVKRASYWQVNKVKKHDFHQRKCLTLTLTWKGIREYAFQWFLNSILQMWGGQLYFCQINDQSTRVWGIWKISSDRMEIYFSDKPLKILLQTLFFFFCDKKIRSNINHLVGRLYNTSTVGLAGVILRVSTRGLYKSSMLALRSPIQLS